MLADSVIIPHMAGSPEKKERNKELLKDLNSGKFFIVDLVAKYRISSARIYMIREKYGNK